MNELNKIPKENPFRVPEGYFEDATDRILIAASGSKEGRLPERRVFRIRPWMAAAVSLTFVAAITIALLVINPASNGEVFSEELSYNGSLEEFLYSIDISVIEAEAAGKITDGRLTEVDNGEIIDFLVMQNIKILDIFEHL